MTIDWQMKRQKLDGLLTIDKLTDWLGKQDPGREYVWSDPVNCLMGKYLADHDVEWGTGAYSELPEYHQVAQAKPWTFGAALQRAEQLRLSPPSELATPLQIEARAEEIVYEPGRGQGESEVQPEHIEHRQYLGGPDQAGHGEIDQPVRPAIEHAGG